MSKSKHVYMMITNDKYELPLAVADTVEELASIVNTTPNSIYSAMSHFKNNKDLYKSCKYIKVKIK